MTSNVFSLLHDNIRAVLKNMSISSPTEVQIQAIPKILEGASVLIISPTGSGKTEAALLPIFHKILLLDPHTRQSGILAIYVTPLRALNRDMFARVFDIASRLGISVMLRHGDTKQSERRRQSEHPAEILITTPETLQAILPNRKMQRWLKAVRWVVVDEIHSLISSKRGVQLTLGLERLREITKSEVQIVGLSATVGKPSEVGSFLVGVSRPFDIVDASREKTYEFIVEMPQPSETDYSLSLQLRVSPHFAARLRRMKELIEKHNKVLIFANCREFAEIIGSRLVEMGVNVGVHHSSLSREIREEIEHNLKNGKLKAVVCTSSLELGIDIGDIDLVIQYLSPRQVIALLQRVGRSGHSLSKVSKGVIITGYSEDVLEILNLIKLSKESKLETPRMLKNSLDVLAHQIVGIVLDHSKIKEEYVYKVFKRAYPYKSLDYENFLRVIDFVAALGYIRVDSGTGYLHITKRSRRYYYEHLTMIPDEIKYPVYDYDTGNEIAYLGEDFFAEHGKPGTIFILRGRPWKIIEIHGMKVFVQQTDELEAAIPSWEGPILPLHIETAIEMGKLRRALKHESNLTITNLKKIFGDAVSCVNEQTHLDVALSLIKEHIKKGLPLPDDKNIVLEHYKDMLIVHSVFGDAVNRSLANVIYDYLTNVCSQTPLFRIDGYRIMFLNVPSVNLEKLKEYLINLSDEEFKNHLEGHLDSYEMRHIALRFGAMPLSMFLKTPDYLRRLPEEFYDTPVYDETVNVVLTEKFDFDNSLLVLRKIRNKDINIDYFVSEEGPSPLAIPIIERFGFGQEIITKADTPSTLKDIIMKQYVKLICTECGNLWTAKIAELNDSVICEKCNSTFIAPLFWRVNETVKVIREYIQGKYFENEDAEKLWVNAKLSADLTHTYGKKAIMALAVRGVGPATAFPILAKMHRDLDSFFEDLLEAKKTWLRTREYWNDI